jgi:uncharacterized membrane protein YfcA
VLPDFELWQWLLGGTAALMVGLAKSGVPVAGPLIVPLMVLTVGDARITAAWTVTLLSVGDIYAVAYWHRKADVGKLLSLIPWVAIGMAGGATALVLPETAVRPMIGCVVLVMVLLTLFRHYPRVQAVGHTSFYGIAAGFSTTIANYAGPVMNMYLLNRRLPKEQFVATAAWFFLVVNLAKVPIYVWHDLYSRQGFAFNLTMVPLVLTGNILGVWIVHRIPQRVFEILIIALTLISSLTFFA